MADAKDGEHDVTQADRSHGGGAAPAEPAAEGAPPVDFGTFCLSLGTSALYHLGVVGDPRSGKPLERPDVAAARQTIDLLELLQRKTRGNLEAEEARLLEGLLYELRMRFVEVKAKQA